MIKSIASFIFLVFIQCTFAQASDKRAANSILIGHIGPNYFKTSQDTLPKVIFVDNSLVSFQNGIYKNRLDSIRKDVDLSYNAHVQKYIDTYINRKEHIGKMLGLSEYYFPIFEKALKEIGLPDELKYITVIESSLNPNAVSRSGAVGPWQFMYTTAKGYGLTMDTYTDERKDPQKASLAAAHYLNDAYKSIGDWLLAIAAFNCGTGAVTRAIAKSGGVADFWKVRPFLPVQTQNYVPAFIATVYAMNYHKIHEIAVKPAGFNTLTDIVPVNRRISISSIAKAAELDINELLILNPSYKKQIINGTNLVPMPLVIPSVTNAAYSSLYDLFNGKADEVTPVPVLSGLKEPATRAIVHKVKTGQNLNSIADLYGVEVQDLKVWNNLKNTSIVPGQTLRLSPSKKSETVKKESSYVHYIVKVGDTLSGIAEKFKGLTVSKIKALNGLSNSAISPGMRLKINKS
ncbi:membrane-bound lytic murein transglycosylase D [Daejeonella rubra]|uniref:Membrane-bound lytic murein transglycosylase D n=1 Tax=Daejeonella rubra TaxID=990371 RepID=A0A1G9NX37_9SPHI|nr:lytic transglycosylase domain-containing protein [Daejeonella rubra]SDL90921.1 membrane-bound lytic murein transglycosylase D [Daejeonella rubra]